MKTSKKLTHKINFNNRRKLPLHRLPFIDRVPEKEGYSFWSVPKTGSYLGGCRTGEALALIYLKHLREHGNNSRILQGIAFDMFGHKATDSPETIALRGQIVGFFSTLDCWLEGTVKELGQNLDSYSNQSLLEKANQGLNFTDEYDLSITEEDANNE